MRLWIGTLLAVVLAGCALFQAPQSVLMVHPKSGDIVMCEDSLVYPYWPASIQCIQQLQLVGYKRAEDLTPKERAALRPELRKFKFKGEIKTR